MTAPKPEANTEFESLLERARHFPADTRAHAIEDLQRLVMRPLQSRHMVDAYLKPDDCALDELQPWRHFGLTYIPGAQLEFGRILVSNRLNVDTLPPAKLGRDMVLPTCWQRNSLVNILGSIGVNRKVGRWKQDDNHRLMYWFPLNIWWVYGGNHSITQGIVNAEGEVKAEEAYDLSPLYEYIRFDGHHWVDLQTGETIGTPRYPELGYVFELGRLLIGHGTDEIQGEA